ncbi:MAG: alpha/beta fold hydrolase [Rubrobacteraceae bacterium]
MAGQNTGSPGIEDLFERYVQGLEIMAEGARAETGQTPKEIIWSRNKAKLYHYRPGKEKQHPIPVLLIYALVNRSYILDLKPGNSFVEHLLSEGFDVYMLDWGIPGPEDKDMSFENYVLDYMPRAVKKVLRNSGTVELTMFGYCMGGTMSAMYAALFPERLRNLVLLATPIDFTPEDVGLYGIWFDERYQDPDLVAATFGNVPAPLAYAGTAMLRPMANYVGAYVPMWELLTRGKPMDSWSAMNKWANDPVPVPGAAFKQWVEDFYQQNKLVKGELELRGRPVDLSNIRMPLLNLAGEKDHLCFLPQAEATMDLVGSEDQEFVTLDAGHVGLVMGRGAREGLWPQTTDWLKPRSGGQ